MNDDYLQHWQAYQQGDEKALNVVCEALFSKLFFVFMKRCRHREQAEDLTQETLTRLIEQKDHKSIIDPLAWAFRTEKNLHYQDIRKENTHRKHEGTLKIMKEGNTHTLESRVYANEIIKIASGNLNPMDWKIFTMENQGYKDDEIADELKKGKKTIQNRKSELKKKLQKLLGNLLMFVLLIYFL